MQILKKKMHVCDAAAGAKLGWGKIAHLPQQ